MRHKTTIVIPVCNEGKNGSSVPTAIRQEVREDRPDGKSGFKSWERLPRYLTRYFAALRGTEDPARETGKLVRFGGIVLFLLFLLTHLPDAPSLLASLEGSSLDSSWVRILCHAHQQNLQFGRDIIFNYGPLGYLLFPYDPIRLFLSSLFSFALLLPFGSFFIRKRSVSSLFFLLLAALGSFLFTIIIANPAYEVFVFLFPLLIWNILKEENAKIKYGVIVYASIMGALCVFVKFMSVPIILVSLVLADVLLLKRNRIVLATPVFLLALPLIWRIPAQQDLSNLVSFFINSWHISAGYNYALALGPGSQTPLWIPWLGISGGVIFFAALFGKWRHEFCRTAVERICFILLLGAPVFVLCKYGIIRMDPAHIFPAVRGLTLLAVFSSADPDVSPKWRFVLIVQAFLLTAVLAVCYGQRWLAPVCPGILFVFCAAILFYILDAYAVSKRAPRLARLSLWSVFILLTAYVFLLPWVSAQIKNYRSYSMYEPVVRAEEANMAPSSADCFSHEIRYLLHSKVAYRPRPVIQSCSAYTPRLLRRNAAHFEYDPAPDYIFYGPNEIDWFLPSAFDSLSLLQIMNNYEPVPGKMLLRKKKDRPPAVHLEEIRKEHSDFDCGIDVPKDSPVVWITIDFQESATGFLLKNMIKPTAAFIQVTLDNGKVFSNRINPENCSVPFLLSPYLPSWNYLEFLFEPRTKELPKVVKFSVYPYFYCFSYVGWSTPEPYFPSGGKWDRDIGSLFYKKGFTVHFYRMVRSSPEKDGDPRP